MHPTVTREMSALEEYVDFIREKVEIDGWTHGLVSEFFKENFPGRKGFSIRSVERLCSKWNIHKTSRLSDQQVDEAGLCTVQSACSLLAHLV